MPRSVDLLNVMTYDFNGAWDTITGLNSPLYSRADEAGIDYGGTGRSTLNLVKMLSYTSFVKKIK